MQPKPKTLERLREMFAAAGHPLEQYAYSPQKRVLYLSTTLPGNHPGWDDVHKIIGDDPNIFSFEVKSIGQAIAETIFDQLCATNNAMAEDIQARKPPESFFLDEVNKSKWMNNPVDLVKLAREHVEHQESGRHFSKHDLLDLKILLETQTADEFIEGIDPCGSSSEPE